MTFRLRAPEAKVVKVSGDFGADAGMQRSADGVPLSAPTQPNPCVNEENLLE